VRGPRVGAWLLACELALFLAVIAIAGPIDRVHLIGGPRLRAHRPHEHGDGRADRGDPPRRRTAVATTYQTGAIARMARR